MCGGRGHMKYLGAFHFFCEPKCTHTHTKRVIFPSATSLEQAEHKQTTTIRSFTKMFFGGAGKCNMKSNKRGNLVSYQFMVRGIFQLSKLHEDIMSARRC